VQQIDRLYKIIEQVRHSFKLKLLDFIKVYLVFYTKKLRKDPGNPLPGQFNLETLPFWVNDAKEYKVQEVLAVKLA